MSSIELLVKKERRNIDISWEYYKSRRTHSDDYIAQLTKTHNTDNDVNRRGLLALQHCEHTATAKHRTRPISPAIHGYM